MPHSAHPPTISHLVLRFAARQIDLPDLADDAAELFEHRQTSQGRPAAVRWYRAQARSASLRVIKHWVHGWGRAPLTGLSLDARLGFRMLRRYPGLTLVGGMAMAFAIFVGSVLFEFINQTLPGRDLPLAHGDRVVGLRWWNQADSVPQQLSSADVHYWQSTMPSLELVGGFATAARHVETQDGQSSLEQVAVMSSNGFLLAGATPLLGRVFTDDDVRAGETSVVVINESTWIGLFARATDVVGRRVRVGDEDRTVIGVMPDSFKFPVSQTMWVPLDARRDIPVRGFARLTAGVSLEQVQQQVTALASGAPTLLAAAGPTRVAAQVQWYRESLFDVPVTVLLRVVVQQLNLFAALFLMLVASNIALLMFARAATRERELVVRSALGAGRRRIVTQFLIEALALFGMATAAGLAATGPGLAWVERRIADMGGGTSPFWFSASVSFETIVYAALLTVCAALMAGGIPALRATRQLSASRIQETGGGAGRLTLGGIWTVVVVAQVTATVVFTAGAALMWRQARLTASVDAAFPATDYVDVYLEAKGHQGNQSSLSQAEQLAAHLSQVPGVAGATVADRLPLMAQHRQQVEIEGHVEPVEVSMPQIAGNFFEVFQAAVVAGRALRNADRVPGSDVVVVDEAFVADVLGGQNVIGRRMRIAGQGTGGLPHPWLHIVGVVRSLETDPPGRLYLDNQTRPFVYRPLGAEATASLLHVAVHAPGLSVPQLATIRKAAISAAGAFTVHEVQPLDRVVRTDAAFWQLWAELILITSAITLLLALAGIYAVMSFTVTRRTREIGIRMALGARGTRVALEVLQGPVRHVLAGVCLGCVVVTGLYWTATGRVAWAELLLLALFGAALALVCGLACLGPARRALAVEPTKAIAG